MFRQIPINGFDSNFSYFLSDESEDHGKEIAIVDPDDVPHLVFEINEEMLLPQLILLTHSHHDHVAGVPAMIKKYAIPVYMHENARGRVEVPEDMSLFVKDGDLIELGSLKIKVLHTPGHIDDAVCYYIAANSAPDGIPRLITGDTLFVECCGRADLEGGNVKDFYRSLNRLKYLPDETRIYPGHDYGSKPVSTIAWEKLHNSYFKCNTLEEFVKLRLGQ